MERGSDSQREMLAHQLDHDRKMRVLDRLHDFITQGEKGLVVLNGGAAVAMLAFVQALVDKPVYHGFKPYALGALACFLFGAFFAAVAFFFHHTYINHAFQDSRNQKIWRRVAWGILIVSAGCAFIGGFLVVAGIFVAV